jgi:glyoxylase-like metal-dependent hydrolase (beta-lactamase superfamily II)
VKLIKIRKITVGPLMTNCYIISSNKECVIIDAGGNPEKIIEEIEEFSYVPKFIMATHGHFDHFLAVKKIQERYPIPFMINKRDVPILESSEFEAERFIPGILTELPLDLKTFEGTFPFFVGDHKFKIIETPGHTPGSSCVVGDGYIFTGDTLFKLSVGRTDMGGNETELINSLKVLYKMKESTKIYPGHGESSDIRFEILNNLYFRNSAEKGSLY